MKRLAVVFLIAMACMVISGCTTQGKEHITGTWEWADGKGYVERYTFGQDHSFRAVALGSNFSGAWEEVSPGHYRVTYRNTDPAAGNETLTENVLYDQITDAIYFPAHHRV
ncbi:MAG: hypothetical protein LUQ25_00045 [Methanoregulaceae archaeon]|nr:hypothetical protein [Methanoregulaceae archaeon]